MARRYIRTDAARYSGVVHGPGHGAESPVGEDSLTRQGRGDFCVMAENYTFLPCYSARNDRQDTLSKYGTIFILASARFVVTGE